MKREETGVGAGTDETLPAAASEDATMPASASDDALAELVEVDRSYYRFGGELARGGMGRILYARDLRIGRPVAVKELLHPVPGMAARFEREARLTGRLQHPAIVPVYEAGRWSDGEPFYAMKKVEGRPLARLIDEADDLDDRLALLPEITRVAEAIAYAHSQRVIHRDLKPANVLVGAFGETVVIDWGLAKDLAEPHTDAAPEPAADAGEQAAGAGLTIAGAVLGTPAYMPPEQARGDPVDERADVYALGAILYHALAGVPAYTGKSSDEVLARVIEGPPRPLAELQPGVPADLSSIVEKAMAHDPGDRYPSGAELAEELRRFRRGQLVAAHRYSPLALVWRWVARHRAVVAIAAIAAVVVATAVGLAIQRVRAEARVARANLAALLEEQGRLELQGGHPLRAATYLAEAYRQTTAPTAALETMLGQVASSARGVEQVLGRHGAPVTSIALGAGGATLYSGSLDGTVAIWDLGSGERRASIAVGGPVTSIALGAGDRRLAVVTDRSIELRDGGGELVATLATAFGSTKRDGVPIFDADKHPFAAFSPDGSRLVVGGLRTWVQVNDAETGDALGALAGHEDIVDAAAFSPGGDLIITGGRDATARIWDATYFYPRAVLRHDTAWGPSAIRAVELRSDGKRALTATSLGVVTVWDLESQKEIRRFQVGPVEIAYSPDESRILTVGGEVELWREDRDEPVARLFGAAGLATAARFDGRGGAVVVGDDAGGAVLWDLETLAPRASLLAHGAPITAARLTADGRVVTASADWRIIVWRPRGGPLARVFGTEFERLRGARLGPAGRLVAAIAPGAGPVIWDAASGEIVARHAEPASDVALGPRGERMVTLGPAGLELRRVADGGRIAALGGAGSQGRRAPATFSADGALVATIGPGGAARLWSADGGEARADLGGGAIDVAFAPGGRLAVASERAVALWDTGAGKRLWTSDPLPAKLTGVRPTPDGDVLALDERGAARLLDGATGTVRRSLAHHNAALTDAAFLPGGLVVLASRDHTASVSELESGALRVRLEGHQAPIWSVAASPRGELLLTASSDGTTRLWDARSGRQLATIPGTEVPAMAAAGFTADGRGVVSALGDVAMLWDIAPARPARADLGDLERIWTLEDGQLVRRRER